jgi:hypothetical protein
MSRRLEQVGLIGRDWCTSVNRTAYCRLEIQLLMLLIGHDDISE